MSLTPRDASSLNWCSRNVLPSAGTMHLGRRSVSGRSRVPSPPARISICISVPPQQATAASAVRAWRYRSVSSSNSVPRANPVYATPGNGANRGGAMPSRRASVAAASASTTSTRGATPSRKAAARTLTPPSPSKFEAPARSGNAAEGVPVSAPAGGAAGGGGRDPLFFLRRRFGRHGGGRYESLSGAQKCAPVNTQDGTEDAGEGTLEARRGGCPLGWRRGVAAPGGGRTRAGAGGNNNRPPPLS